MEMTTEWSKTVSGMPVSFAIPVSESSRPSVILLHERYGLVKHTLDIGERLARNGYLVACPDLYYEYPDQEALHAGDGRAEVTDEAVLSGLEEVESLLCSMYSGDPERLAVMGVCATGRYPLAYAASHAVRGCVSFYGGLSENQWASTALHPIPMETYLDTVSAPVLAVYGERDHTIPIMDVMKFRAALEARDISYEITVYPGMPHGWLNDTMPGRYRASEAELTWAQLLGYLDRVLAGASGGDESVQWSFTLGKSRDYDFSSNMRLE